MLHEAMNTYNPALFYLHEMGYVVKVIILEDVPSKGEENINLEDVPEFIWEASKGRENITAFNPLSLLALVVIYNKYGDNWMDCSGIDLYDQILESCFGKED